MSTFRQLWIRWKMLRLPWRKRFLVGQDLVGNTYWEFKDALSHGRMRRIVKGARQLHHADVQISPQWHQWLRYTRPDPPTIQEQQMDVARQIQLKHNARLADERWASKKRYIEKPAKQQEEKVERPTIGGEGQEAIQGDDALKMETANKDVRSAVAGSAEQARQSGRTKELDPWEQERKKQKETAANPGGTWQPEAWSPGVKRR